MRGWWELKVNCELIKEGYTQGEIVNDLNEKDE